jgi:hypothetical protein
MPVRERARPLELLHPDLLDVILKSFFPDIFIAAEHVISTRGLALDLDGRVLASLINFLVKNRSRDMNDLVGCNVVTRVYRIWSDLGAEPIDLEGFAARYPSQPPPPPSIPVTSEPLRLLPFDNEVFNDELKPIHIGVEDQVDDTSSAYMDFGGGTLFSDTQHWHNTRKAILPSHLGGTNPKPMDERQRRRFLRSEQRFMATLQRQAGTLTGALGASLQQIVIPPVGNQESKALKVRPAIKVRYGYMACPRILTMPKHRRSRRNPRARRERSSFPRKRNF